MYSILLDSFEKREMLRTHLADRAVTVKVYFDCVHLTNYYRDLYGLNKGELPNTEDISERILSLPIFPTLTSQKQRRVCEEIRGVLKS
jgi:perosamine synthetase